MFRLFLFEFPSVGGVDMVSLVNVAAKRFCSSPFALRGARLYVGSMLRIRKGASPVVCLPATRWRLTPTTNRFTARSAWLLYSKRTMQKTTGKYCTHPMRRISAPCVIALCWGALNTSRERRLCLRPGYHSLQSYPQLCVKNVGQGYLKKTIAA